MLEASCCLRAIFKIILSICQHLPDFKSKEKGTTVKVKVTAGSGVHFPKNLLYNLSEIHPNPKSCEEKSCMKKQYK